MFYRFTDRARRALHFGSEEAMRLNDEFIQTQHILLGIVKEKDGVAANVLEELSTCT
jgi:ATP-dependent Clp protease ATP-binding subunit ClpC